MGFKMDKHKEKHDTPGADASFAASKPQLPDTRFMTEKQAEKLGRIRQLDADGKGFKATVAGKQALNELARQKHVDNVEILDGVSVLARAKRCAENDLCFVSLKPLAGQVTTQLQHGLAGDVKVLSRFYSGPVTSM